MRTARAVLAFDRDLHHTLSPSLPLLLHSSLAACFRALDNLFMYISTSKQRNVRVYPLLLKVTLLQLGFSQKTDLGPTFPFIFRPWLCYVDYLSLGGKLQNIPLCVSVSQHARMFFCPHIITTLSIYTYIYIYIYYYIPVLLRMYVRVDVC